RGVLRRHRRGGRRGGGSWSRGPAELASLVGGIGGREARVSEGGATADGDDAERSGDEPRGAGVELHEKAFRSGSLPLRGWSGFLTPLLQLRPMRRQGDAHERTLRFGAARRARTRPAARGGGGPCGLGAD